MAGVPGLVILVEPRCRHVSVQPPCLNRSKRPLQWPDLAEDQRKRFDRFNATASSQLSSPDGSAAIPRAPRKFLLCCPAPRKRGCASVRLRPVDRHRGRNGAGSETENGDLQWQPSAPSRRPARTNSPAKLLPSASRPRACASSPSHRVLVGRAEIGAAWSKRSNEGREYLGLKLDDPSFTAPIYANLFDDEDGESHSLIWSRPNGRRGD